MWRSGWRAWWRVCALMSAAAAVHATPPETSAAPQRVADGLSADASHLVTWVRDTAENQGRPFAVVDKREARIHVFDASGRPAGDSAVLLGQTPGDLGFDLADRHPYSLPPIERTTPAGRFVSRPGHNDKGEAVVWFDYAAALAIHRLRPAPPAQRRAQRLDSPTPDDNRISLGCVIVPEAFYDAVVAPLLGRQRGVVYVLPESMPVRAMFGGFALAQNAF